MQIPSGPPSSTRRGEGVRSLVSSKPYTGGEILRPPSAWCSRNILGLGPRDRRCNSCRADHFQMLPWPNRRGIRLLSEWMQVRVLPAAPLPGGVKVARRPVKPTGVGASPTLAAIPRRSARRNYGGYPPKPPASVGVMPQKTSWRRRAISRARVAQSPERSASNAEDGGGSPSASANVPGCNVSSRRPGSEPGGRRCESCHPDHFRKAGRYKLAAPVSKTGSVRTEVGALPTPSAKFQSSIPGTDHENRHSIAITVATV